MVYISFLLWIYYLVASEVKVHRNYSMTGVNEGALPGNIFLVVEGMDTSLQASEVCVPGSVTNYRVPTMLQYQS